MVQTELYRRLLKVYKTKFMFVQKPPNWILSAVFFKDEL